MTTEIKNMKTSARADLAEDSDDVTVLAELARDVDPSVRIQVARNSASTLDILMSLRRDPSFHVRKVIPHHKNKSEELLWDMARNDVDPDIRSTVAIFTHDPALLDFLSRDEGLGVRESVSNNEHTSTPTLERLLSEGEDSLSFWIARHPQTTTAMLDRIARDAPPYVAAEMVQHKNLSHEALMVLLSRFREIEDDAEAAETLYDIEREIESRGLLSLLGVSD